MAKKPQPPGLAQWLLRLFLFHEERFEKLGDFCEGYSYKIGEIGPLRSRFWYWAQVLKVIPAFIKNLCYWSVTMFLNYLKITVRNLIKYKSYSLINITGLAVGIACCILIFLWVSDELDTNSCHQKSDSLYLLRTVVHYGTEVDLAHGSAPAVGPALKAEYPEVINAARLSNGQYSRFLKVGENTFRENIQLADPEIFDMFTFPLSRGNYPDASVDPFVMIISERIAAKYFADTNPIGQNIVMDGKDSFRVVGVMKEIPHNSTIRFDVWVPLDIERKWSRPDFLDTWYNLAFRTYLQMSDNVDTAEFNEKIKSRIKKNRPDAGDEPFIYPFSDIYLKLWNRQGKLKVFSIIAFMILLIACINFMNLTTARSTQRAREVGMRKVVGAQRRQVMWQFFGESTIFTLISLALALLLVILFLPAFRNLTQKPFQLGHLINFKIIAGIVSISLITGLCSGIYPALFLSAFRPISVLKGTFGRGRSGTLFRRVLVVVQFTMSVMLLIGTIVIFKQIQYMKRKDLGLEKEHLVAIMLEGKLEQNYAAMKEELLRHGGFASISCTTHSPTGVFNNGAGWDWEGRDPSIDPLVTYYGVDPDFIETFQMELARGDSFLKDAANSGTKVLINERFADIIGHKDIVGTRLSNDGNSFNVIGVLKNFHFTPVTGEIGPIIVYHNPPYRQYKYMFMRLNPDRISTSISHLEETYKQFNPGFPCEYRFMDEVYDQMFRRFERDMSLIHTFTFLAILISCLGLFGLAAFTAELRTKEIGIRKVIGASISGIILLLSKDYSKWVLLSNMFAWPLAYWAMSEWIQEFAYRIPIGIPVFLLSGITALFLALITVAFQAVKAARSNPVDSLKYE